MLIAIAVLAAYALGSVPFGYVLGRIAGKDIRLEGSKNIGATNLWRVCGWKFGLTCFVLDFAKGWAAVALLRLIRPGDGTGWLPIAAALCAVLGHNFPVWLRFRGGKGVATSAGAVAALMPPSFCIAIGAFILTVAAFRYISLGSMTASVALVAANLFVLPEPLGRDLPLFAMSCLLCAMILLRHRANIGRILAGTENRFPPPKKV